MSIYMILLLLGCISGLVALIVLFSFSLATRIVYGFRWKAICGLERQAKRKVVMYISNAMFEPTPVFWLGSNDWQEELVADSVVEGRLPRQQFNDAVDGETHWEAITKRVDVWPSRETKQLFGKPEDIAA